MLISYFMKAGVFSDMTTYTCTTSNLVSVSVCGLIKMNAPAVGAAVTY